jgi:hypothetical protein
MSTDPTPEPSGPPTLTVFLSYASEDRKAAQALRDALPTLGVEVWYDETDLAGGDAWDQKIRQQIRECDFFMPVISAQTEARHEGYFRREWRLAVERSLDMADDHLFLLPVVIDDTPQSTSRVPEKFLQVQWTRVPGGQPNPALEALCRRMLAGDAVLSASARATRAPRSHPPTGTTPTGPLPDAGFESTGVGADTAAARAMLSGGLPPFPREEPGQRSRFWFEVVGWTLQCAWIIYRRMPRWARIIIGIWVVIALLRSCSGDESEAPHHPKLSAADTKKLEQIADSFHAATPADYAQLGTQIARAFSSAGVPPGRHARLLAIPFTAPQGDEAGRKLADATFALVYGRMAIDHAGYAAPLAEELPAVDDQVALERARAQHSRYVLFGAVDGTGDDARLTVKMLKVKDGSVLWTGSYPGPDADPATIAKDVDHEVHTAEDDE